MQNRMILVVVFDNLITFTCTLRIYEGSELVPLGVEVACTDFTYLDYSRTR